MSTAFDASARYNIRAALARHAYNAGTVRIVDPDLSGFVWLVSTHRGLFAVAPGGGAKLVAHGWFFGIFRRGSTIWLFENCALRDRTAALGRVVRIELANRRLTDPAVLTTGLPANCHQLAVIDDLICVVDTANQSIRRFALDGTPVDIKRPLPAATPDDTSGAYCHMNSIAQAGGQIAVMLHNGKALPEKNSELAFLDADWKIGERRPLGGRMCHDIVEDPQGVLWHSASASGELITSDGRRVPVTDTLMTRGIAFACDLMLVGVTTFGARQIRDGLRGGVVILDRTLNPRETIPIDGPPADIVALWNSA